MSLSRSTSPLRRFDRVAFCLLAGVMLLILCYLTGYCMLFTSVLTLDETVTQTRDPLWLSLMLTAAGACLCRSALLWERRAPLPLLTGLALGVTFALGCAWVLIARSIPINDTGIIYYAAADLMRGDLAFLEVHDVYLRVNPHQAGILQFSEVLQRVFGRGSYLPQGILNAAFLTASYAALLDVLWQSLHSRRAQLVALVMMITCLPPVFFCTFLYGNLPGLCLSLWALALVVRWVHGMRWLWLIPACALMAAAVMLKPNYLIFALALAAVTALYAISARRFGALVLAACLLAGSVALPKGAQWVLEKRTGASLGSGAPQTTWMAMGMQDGPCAAGWYNRYTIHTAEAAECDMERMAELVKHDIHERMSYFASHPTEAFAFYHEKLVSQWAETTYESLFINRVMPNKSNVPALRDALLNGSLSKALSLWMEGYALTLYLGAVLSMVRSLRALRRGELCWEATIGLAVLLVAVFGGWLYHMLFEAKSQYLMIYIVMMIPLAAVGWSFPRPVRSR